LEGLSDQLWTFFATPSTISVHPPRSISQTFWEGDNSNFPYNSSSTVLRSYCARADRNDELTTTAVSIRFALCLASEAGCKMARVYADVNQQMPRSYWDYDSVNITWGVLENYEVVRKIGKDTVPSHIHNKC